MSSADKERIKTILASYTKAVMRLEQGLKEDPHDHDIVIDGVIQRFEFCFELAWKALKAFLRYQGVDCNSPRSCIKSAFTMTLISAEDKWINMLEDRNRTAHIYDEDEARKIYRTVKNTYANELLQLKKALLTRTE